MCLRPLWIIILGYAGVAVVVAICGWYAKRAADRPEQLARTKLMVLLVCVLGGGVLLWHFVAICATDASCRAGIDLNCNGARPMLYQWLSIAAFVAAGGLIAYEIRRQFR